MRDACRALPPHELAALEVLAVVRTPVARSHVLNVLRRLGVTRDAAKKSLDSTRILTALEHLAAARLLGGDPSGRYGYTCEPALARELLRSLRAAGRLDEVVATVRAVKVPLDDAGELWIALHAEDFAGATAVLRRNRATLGWANPVLPLLDEFEGEAGRWPDALVAEFAGLALATSVQEVRPFDGAYAVLEAAVAAGRDGEEVRLCLAAWRVLRGDAARAEDALQALRSPRATALRAWVALARNDVAEAARCFAEAPMAADAPPAERLDLLWRAVVLLHQGDFRGVRAHLRANTSELPASWREAIVAPLDTVARLGLAEIAADDWDVRKLSFLLTADSPLARVVLALACWWATPDAFANERDDLHRLRDTLDAAGLRWLTATLTEMIARLAGQGSLGSHALLDAMQQTAPWQRALTALEGLLAREAATPPRAPPRPKREAAPPTSRIAWVVALGPVLAELQPVEQMAQAGRAWSKGRPIALERLSRGDPKLPITEADRRVIAFISSVTYRHRGYPETTWSIDTASALEALVDHPHVCVAGDPPTPAQITRGEVALEVVEAPDELVLRFSPKLHKGVSYAVAQDSPLTLRVVRVPDALAPYIPVIGDGVRVPRAQRERVDRLVPLLPAVAKVRFVVESKRGK